MDSTTAHSQEVQDAGHPELTQEDPPQGSVIACEPLPSAAQSPILLHHATPLPVAQEVTHAMCEMHSASAHSPILPHNTSLPQDQTDREEAHPEQCLHLQQSQEPIVEEDDGFQNDQAQDLIEQMEVIDLVEGLSSSNDGSPVSLWLIINEHHSIYS